MSKSFILLDLKTGNFAPFITSGFYLPNGTYYEAQIPYDNLDSLSEEQRMLARLTGIQFYQSRYIIFQTVTNNQNYKVGDIYQHTENNEVFIMVVFHENYNNKSYYLLVFCALFLIHFEILSKISNIGNLFVEYSLKLRNYPNMFNEYYNSLFL